MKPTLQRIRRPLVWLGLAVVYALPLLTLRGAMDMFLNVAGVPGESLDDKHKGEIDVLAWSWRMSNPGSFHNGGKGSTRMPSAQDISFTKFIDKASPNLMYHLFTGEPMESAKLTIRKAGGAYAVEYLVFTLSPVIVTSYTTGGSGNEDRFTENVSLNFGKMSLDYTEQHQDGTAGKVYPAVLDFATGP